MLIDFTAKDARTKSAQAILSRRHTVRSGILFSKADTPPDLLVLPIPATRDGYTLNGTPYTVDDCKKALMQAEKRPTLLGYGECPDALRFADYRDLSKDERFVSANAELTAEGGMMLLSQALSAHGVSLYGTAAVILGYGRIARGMAARLFANGAQVLIGARRAEARKAAETEGYLTFDTADRSFFSERGRLLFAERTHVAVNTVPSPSVIPTLEKMPNPFCALELSGKSDVLAACEALPYPCIDGKAIPTRFFGRSAGEILAEAIHRQIVHADT